MNSITNITIDEVDFILDKVFEMPHIHADRMRRFPRWVEKSGAVSK
ncbi:hypothetical protein [uncultured Bacteroides sp.]|nr:hypothetical protein [uncultured Bacteroides sp.]